MERPQLFASCPYCAFKLSCRGDSADEAAYVIGRRLAEHFKELHPELKGEIAIDVVEERSR